MTEWISIVLDVVVIVLVGAGIMQVMRLIGQLRDLRAGRADMERFVRDFNAAVTRAEAGIKGLRSAAREAGDDLEKLIEKGTMVRDELNFIVESADSVAERLSTAAAGVLHSESAMAKKEEPKAAPSAPATESRAAPFKPKEDAPPSSRAEKELLQALQKLK